MRARVPRIERVLADAMPDGRLLLQIKDARFANRVWHGSLPTGRSRCSLTSCCYTIPHRRPSLVSRSLRISSTHGCCLISPKNAEPERGQLLVTTHSPFFINALRPKEVRVLFRDEAGYTQVKNSGGHPRRQEFMETGALLGHLWMEGHFGLGDPLVNQGAPRRSGWSEGVRAAHLEILVEEPSMEAFLRALLPRLLAERATFEVYPHQGKSDLLGKIGARLRAYAHWLPDDWRIVVVVDRDNDDCDALKRRMEQFAADGRFPSRAAIGSIGWRVVDQIAIEGAGSLVFRRLGCSAENLFGGARLYPAAGRLSERGCHRGRHMGGLRAGVTIRRTFQRRTLGRQKRHARSGRQCIRSGNRSRSFTAFRDAVIEAVSC